MVYVLEFWKMKYDVYVMEMWQSIDGDVVLYVFCEESVVFFVLYYIVYIIVNVDVWYFQIVVGVKVIFGYVVMRVEYEESIKIVI